MSCVHECNVTFLLEVTWDRGNDSFEVLHRCLLVVQIFSGYPFCCQGSYWIPFENENDENENENDENENENENEEKKRKYTLIQLLKMMADVNSARGVVRARLTMHRGTVLGDANKRPVPKNSPVMHCQRRYYQASCAIPKWLIVREINVVCCVGSVEIQIEILYLSLGFVFGFFWSCILHVQ